VLGPVRDALVTAFATGNLLIVLPILARHGKQTLLEAGLDEQASSAAVDVLVPASFTIPNMGKLLSLAFVPFAGWYTGFGLSLPQYPLFATVGFASLFGEPVVSLPFLLDLLGIPADTFGLFVTIDVITSRFGTLLAAVHTLVLALMAAFIMTKGATLRWSRVGTFIAGSTLLLAVPIVGSRLLFTYGMQPQYTKYKEFVETELLSDPVETHILDAPPTPSPEDAAPGRRLERIRERGSLRVGYFADALPLAFRNARGHLVGFDVDMMQLLARELAVTLDLVRIERGQATELLDRGSCDLVVCGVPITPEFSSSVRFSTPVMKLTLALVVPDARRDEYTTWESIRSLHDLKLGVGRSSYYRRRLAELFPDAEIVALSSPREFFTGDANQVDALVAAAEIGSAWTLVYPQFSVAVPRPAPISVPVGYAMPYGDERLHEVVDAFIGLKLGDGTADTLFSHWFEGRSAQGKRHRWSIAHDVLGWID